jgi:hypothetical protein
MDVEAVLIRRPPAWQLRHHHPHALNTRPEDTLLYFASRRLQVLDFPRRRDWPLPLNPLLPLLPSSCRTSRHQNPISSL